MSKRVVWVVEVKTLGKWIQIYNFDTRSEARDKKNDFDLDCNSDVRVVKYVPAETSKKAGVK